MFDQAGNKIEELEESFVNCEFYLESIKMFESWEFIYIFIKNLTRH